MPGLRRQELMMAMESRRYLSRDLQGTASMTAGARVGRSLVESRALMARPVARSMWRVVERRLRLRRRESVHGDLFEGRRQQPLNLA